MAENIKENENAKSSGAFLKSVRQKKGISIETVHEMTKIPLDSIRAIEEGYTIRSMTSFYYKGFLKMYARYLDVDISQIVDDYKKEELPKHRKMPVEDDSPLTAFSGNFSRIQKKHVVNFVAIVIFLFLGSKIFGWVGHKWVERKSKSAVIKDIEAKVEKENTEKKPFSLFASKKIDKKEEKKEVRKQEAKKAEPKTEIKNETKVQEKIEQKAEGKSAKSEEKTVPVAVAVPSLVVAVEESGPTMKKNVTLTVRAKKNSWLRVSADGNVVFQSTLNGGSVETWTADDKIEISGKNISQLEFELNGKMIGTLGREDRSAKSVIVTKNGLSVAK